MSSPARRTDTLTDGEFGNLKMNDHKLDFESLKVYQKALE